MTTKHSTNEDFSAGTEKNKDEGNSDNETTEEREAVKENIILEKECKASSSVQRSPAEGTKSNKEIFKELKKLKKEVRQLQKDLKKLKKKKNKKSKKKSKK